MDTAANCRSWRPGRDPTVMKSNNVDQHAKEKAIRQYGLHPCLHVPIAARNEEAIEKYVGNICEILTPTLVHKALLVRAYEPSARNPKLPIWKLGESSILHYPQQVWVHVDCRAYRSAYARAFPNQDLQGLVLDHILNRRAARLKRFDYLRIVPISRGANSSSGGLPEKWGVTYHNTPSMIKINAASPAFIQYADL